MAFTLFPKSIRFFDLLIQQNEILKDVADELDQVFHDFHTMDDAFKRITIKEEKADELSREIARQLSQTFITPIDREDIYQLNLAQEDSINLLKRIAIRTCCSGLTRIRFPAQKMTRNISKMAHITGEMIRALRAKHEVGAFVKECKGLKEECEMVLSTGLSELQDIEITDFKGVTDIIKWVQIYDRIEQVVERLDDLSDVIEEVVLKNA